MVSVNAWADDFKILALGDSLTAGYGLDQNQGLTVQLQQSLNHNFPDRDIKVMNGGVSGDTTKGGLARLNWALVDNPDMVIVELGANDGLRGLDPKLTEKNLDVILQNLKDRGMKVLLTGMLAPPNLGAIMVGNSIQFIPVLPKSMGSPYIPFFLKGLPGLRI